METLKIRTQIDMNRELNHLLESIDKSDYNDYPYEHFYATEVFSEEFYERILNELPSAQDLDALCLMRGYLECGRRFLIFFILTS